MEFVLLIVWQSIFYAFGLKFDDVNKFDYDMQWDGGMAKVLSTAVDDYDPGLITLENIDKDYHETMVNFDGLDYFAKKLFKHKPETRVIVSHTHVPTLLKSEGKVYMNSGFFCASAPDMNHGKESLTFVEVTETDKVLFWLSFIFYIRKEYDHYIL